MSNEGRNRFYDKNKPQDVVAGLEYAIRKIEESLSKDPDIDKSVLEQHLASLRQELDRVKKKLRK